MFGSGLVNFRVSIHSGGPFGRIHNYNRKFEGRAPFLM